MLSDFVKFPSTPHLLWLGSRPAREDKVLNPAEAAAFLSEPVVIEEKVDGANLGISFDTQGNLLAQNRGNPVGHGTKGQFATLWDWLSGRESVLFDVLEDRLILFGEWCYACHSIRYTQLPDFFLSFDIYDKREQRFASTIRRDEIIARLNLASMPKLAAGKFNLDQIIRLLGSSSLYDGPMEGVYLRKENASWLVQRAKVVRAEFLQEIDEHWSKRPLIPNRLQACVSKTENGP